MSAVINYPRTAAHLKRECSWKCVLSGRAILKELFLEVQKRPSVAFPLTNVTKMSK